MLLTLTEDQRAALRREQYHAGAFVFADVGVRIFSDNRTYIDNFKKIYEAFVACDLAADAFACYILDRCTFCTGPCVIIDGTLYGLPAGEKFISSAEVLIFQRVIDRIQSCLLIHAGVVEKNGNGYIVYAPSGFGKTTFVLRLVSQGYKFLSDEYCPVRSDALTIEPFARRVGIKRGSPFVTAVQDSATDALLCDDKYYVRCDELFPASSGAACRAKYFIMLANDIQPHGRDGRLQEIKVVLFDDTQGIIEKISALDGVRVIERHVLDYCTEYILSLPHNRMLTGALHGIMKQYERFIYFVAPRHEHKTDFSNKPRLSTMHKSEAMFEILANLQNRSPSSALLATHGQKHQRLLMKIGAFLKDVECYRLTTGNLDDMARLVDAL